MAVVLLSQIALAAEPLVVAVTDRQKVSREAALDLAGEIAGVLAAQGFSLVATPEAVATKLQLRGVSDTASCASRPDCVAALGEPFGNALVIGVGVGRFGDKLAVRLVAARAENAGALATSEFVVPVKHGRSALEGPVGEFAEVVKALAPPPPPQKPAPVVENPPAPKPPDADHAVKPPEPAKVVVTGPPEVPAKTGYAVPLACAAAGVVLLSGAAVAHGVASSTQSAFAAQQPGQANADLPTVTRAQANTAVLLDRGAFAGAIVGVGLVTYAGYRFFRHEPAVSLAPAVAPGGAALVLSGRY